MVEYIIWKLQISGSVKTFENVVFELPDGSGRAAALPGPRREVLGAENHPNHGMISARVGMIWTKSS